MKFDNFLGFYLIERGIEANPYKCEAVIQMNLSMSKKEVQKLNDMLTTLNIFILKSSPTRFSLLQTIEIEDRLLVDNQM